MTEPAPDPSLNRRDLLKLGGAMAVVSLATGASQALASLGQPTATPVDTTPSLAGLETLPALPPLEVISLNRLAFGPRPGDYAAFLARPGATPAQKLSHFIDQQLDPKTIDDSVCDQRLQAANLVTLTKTLAQLWNDHVEHNPYPPNTDEYYLWYIRPFLDTRQATIIRAVFSQRQLYEVMVEFWHTHLNVYGELYQIMPLWVQYDRDVIRANALGNFRQMLGAVATSPAMLYYLDNANNQVAGPNENWARELFELHTLGAENYLGVRDPRTVPGFDQQNSIGYVDNDVYEAARCFTGWSIADNEYFGSTGQFHYYRPWHDRFNKLVLGRYIPSDQPDLRDGQDVLDILAAHPGTARFVCRKLCRRLVSDNPPESLVQRAAEVFLAQRNAPDQIAQVVRVIALSDEFRTTWGQKIKRPFETIMTALRATNAQFTIANNEFMYFYGMTGQPLFGHPAPNGFQDHKEDWTNTTALVNSWKVINYYLVGFFADNDDGPMAPNLGGIMPATARSANQITDFWIQSILGRPMDATASRAELARVMAYGYDPDFALPIDHIRARLPRLIELILMSPEAMYR